MKYGLAELVLENQDLPADCGLGDVKLLTGCGKGAGLSDGPNDFELPEVHVSAYMSVRIYDARRDAAAESDGAMRSEIV